MIDRSLAALRSPAGAHRRPYRRHVPADAWTVGHHDL